MMQRQSLPDQQKGSLLLVTLVLLVLMTIIGLSAAVSTMLETKLSANQYDRMMSFQAAESALRAGEEYLSTVDINKSAFTSAPAFATPTAPVANAQRIWLDITAVEPKWWNADPYAQWWQTAAYAVNDGTGEFAAQYAQLPRYVIEFVRSVPASQGSHSDGVGAALTQDYYRITARGVGVTTNNISILQSIYIK